MSRSYSARMRAGWVLLFVLVSLAASPAGAQVLRPDGRYAQLGDYVAWAGSWAGDLDGDGDQELVVGALGSTAVAVLEADGGGYTPRWFSPFYGFEGGQGIARVLVANLDGDADAEIYVLAFDGRLDVYDGGTLERIATFAVGAANAETDRSPSVHFADVDDDGAMELVGMLDGGLRVYDAVTFTEEWSTTAYGSTRDVAIGDVDGDGVTEIVVSSGYVVGGASHEVEWAYGSPFGTFVDLVNVDADAALEIVSLSGDGDTGTGALNAFDAVQRAQLWQVALVGWYGFELLVADADGNGARDVLVVDRTGYRLRAFNPLTQQVLWTILNPDSYFTRLSVGDPDNDGVREVIWGTSYRTSAPDHLLVANPATQQVEWAGENLGPVSALEAGDVDGDGVPELVLAHSAGDGDGSYVRVYDGATRARQWSRVPVYGDVTGMALADMTGDGRADVLVAHGNGDMVAFFDGPTGGPVGAMAVSGATALATLDLNGDGRAELVAGQGDGRLWVPGGWPLAWEGTSTAPVGRVFVAACDADPAPEFVFFNRGGGVQIFDSRTFRLDGEIAGLTGTRSLFVGDIDNDRTTDIVTGHDGGVVRVSSCSDRVAGPAVTVAGSDLTVTSIALGGVDAAPLPRLLVTVSPTDPFWAPAAPRLIALSVSDLSTVWASDRLGRSAGGTPTLVATDLDLDGYLDIAVGTDWSVELFEATAQHPDVVPPYAIIGEPTGGQRYVSRDAAIRSSFSEPIGGASLNGHVTLTADGADVAFTAAYDEAHRALTLTSAGLLPGSSEIAVRLSGLIVDEAGNGLDGNGNGVSEGAGIDDVVWTFGTGSGTDTVGPTVRGLTVDHDTLGVGEPFHLSAVASDSSAVATGRVAAAELFLDAVGAPGTGRPLSAADSTFDATEEALAFTLLTADWAPGARTVFVRARDVRGTWGAPATIVVVVEGDAEPAWPMIGQNPQHTSYSAGSVLAPPMAPEWTGADASTAARGIVATDDAVFVTYASGGLLLNAIDRASGELRWSRTVAGASGVGSPAAAYGLIYAATVGSTSGNALTAFDAATGDVRWRTPFSTQGSQGNGPTVADGKVFLNAGFFGGLYAFDAWTGAVLWSITLPQAFGWTPAYADGVVYAVFNGEYYAIDAETGAILHRPGTTSGFVGYNAVVHDGTLFTTGPTRAIDLATGGVRWTVSRNGLISVGYGRVFIASGSDLVVYDERTGALQWQLSIGTASLQAPLLANGYAYVSTSSETRAIDIDTRAVAWSTASGGPLALTRDRLYTAGGSAPRAFRPLASGTEGGEAPPPAFRLQSVYPNPFQGAATVAYSLPEAATVMLEVFDALGRRVTTLAEELQPAGTYRIAWAPAGLPAGTYLVRLHAGDDVATVRAVLIR